MVKMNRHSVIFIDQPEVAYQRLNRSEKKIFGENSRKVYVDLIGPLLALFLLGSVLHYGHANKHPRALAPTSPTIALLYYILIVPTVCLFFAKLGKANLSPHKILSLLGYGLYGHLLTVGSSLLFDREVSNTFFFSVMVIFGGLSCFRIVIVLLLTIPKPAARLLICSLVSLFHLLFIIFIHFAYMHRTFVYGRKL